MILFQIIYKMILLVLALNCFTDTVVVYSAQTEELTLSAVQDKSISIIDKLSCQIFVNQNVKVQIQIGGIIFDSNFYIYKEEHIDLTLTKISGDLATINQFSVAFFKLESKNDNIMQDGTIIRFSINFFDRRNCFKNISLFYNTVTSDITIQRFPQVLCSFDKDGDITSNVQINLGTQLDQIFEEKLVDTYVEWFQTNNTCKNKQCAKYIIELVEILFPLGYYNVNIQQTFKKTTNAFKPDGTTVEQETEFTMNLVLRQLITQFTTEILISTISNVLIRPLYQSIEIEQTLTTEKPNVDKKHDSVSVDICIATENSNSSQRQCFTIFQDQFQALEKLVYRCDEQIETTIQECTDNLLEISKYTDSQVGLIYYDTFLDDVPVESFKYYSQVPRNKYSPVVLLCMQTHACIDIKIRDGFILTEDSIELILEWETSGQIQRLINVFKFPNEQQLYCFIATPQQLRNLTEEHPSELKLTIGGQSLFVNKILNFLQPRIFINGIITMFILASLLVTMIIFLMHFNIVHQK
ncbi:hypothetical protein SS50377_21745 [Spironucleus salmonicida]|uniref:Transmembrane protein n=2 Tax=Spironucleus salmonicida TaxID=348837 RepID=A0A9P8S0H7_9EUKA|nr:hypothetical protein SS50377_21745 [Spironucleus salmonicida]